MLAGETRGSMCGRVPEGGGWEGRARCGAPRTFHNALVRAVRHCARAVCVGKKRRAGQGLAASSGKAKAHRPTDPPGLLHIQKAERGKREKMQRSIVKFNYAQ